MSSSQDPQQPTTTEEVTFKKQLDRVATDRRTSPTDNQSTNPIVEKITEYIPAAAKVLGGSKEEKPDPTAPVRDAPGPPERPHHDHKIEDFVRDQHRSMTDEGLLNTGKSGA